MNPAHTFTANGRTYLTDLHTLELMREFQKDRNDYMLSFMLIAGCAAGRIQEVGQA